MEMIDNPLVGRHVRVEDSKRGTLTGMVTGARRSIGRIVDLETNDSWPGIQFRIKPDDGSRARWTRAYPDKSTQTEE